MLSHGYLYYSYSTWRFLKGISIRLFDKHLFFKMIHHILLLGHSAYVDVLKTIRKPIFLENLAVKECFDHKFLKTPEIVKKNTTTQKTKEF